MPETEKRHLSSRGQSPRELVNLTPNVLAFISITSSCQNALGIHLSKSSIMTQN